MLGVRSDGVRVATSAEVETLYRIFAAVRDEEDGDRACAALAHVLAARAKMAAIDRSRFMRNVLAVFDSVQVELLNEGKA